MIMLLKSSTGGQSWDTNPRASISVREGLLFVTQTPGVHREIERLLARLQF